MKAKMMIIKTNFVIFSLLFFFLRLAERKVESLKTEFSQSDERADAAALTEMLLIIRECTDVYFPL